MHSTITLLMLMAVVGCASKQPALVNCGVFGTGTRLSNGTVDIVLVPKIGRIMRYGFIGHENMLFIDPAHLSTAPSGQFISYGGDKAWIWPQDDWQKYIGRSFPPPSSADGEPWKLTLLSQRSVRLTSNVIEPWGVRIERDIKLADRGTQVTLTNRLIKLDSKFTPPTAVWSVTQVPAMDEVWVRGADHGPISHRLMMPDRWKAIEQYGRWLRLQRDPAVLSKVGIAGDRVITASGATRFTQTMVSTDPPAITADTDRVQIFTFPNPGAGHPTQVPYTEVEFTSPRTDRTNRPQTVSMTVVWELSPR